MDASVEVQAALLTQEKMRELIKVSQEGDKEARRMMVEGNTRLVWSIVQRFASRGADPGGFVSDRLYRPDEIDR